MRKGQGITNRSPRLESLEDRLLLSSAIKHPATSSASQKSTYVAKLLPGNVVLPLDGYGDQIEGGGGAELYPLPPTTDPAIGKVIFTIRGNEIKVTGTLAHISNVSAITIHDLNDPAVFPLRGSTTSPATQPPALAADTPVVPASMVSLSSTTAPLATTIPPAGTTSTVTQTVLVASTSAAAPSPIETSTTQIKTSYPNGDSATNTTMYVTSNVAGLNLQNAPSPGPLYYNGSTVNSATLSNETSQPGQIMSSNIGQTVETLLNPGNGGGPLPTAATFQTVIRPQYLQGPLSTRKGFAQFIADMRAGNLYVLVQTNNGYDAATGATVDGNYPNGELRGTIK